MLIGSSYGPTLGHEAITGVRHVLRVNVNFGIQICWSHPHNINKSCVCTKFILVLIYVNM